MSPATLFGPVKHRFMIDHTGLRRDEPFIQGHRLAAPQKGICIVKTTLPGGTTTTHKVVLAD